MESLIQRDTIMLKRLLTITLVGVHLCAMTSCSDETVKCKHEIEIQPSGEYGKDATIWTEMPDRNIAHSNSLSVMAWTFYGIGFDEGVKRRLLAFDVTSIKDEADILKATLYLYNAADARDNWGAHSTRNGSNTCKLLPITEPWLENTVTWNNQPATTSDGHVTIQASTDDHQDYTIDVTNLVKQWHVNPSDNNGVMVQLDVEQHYRALIFATSDHTNPELRPKLVVTYQN